MNRNLVVHYFYDRKLDSQVFFACLSAANVEEKERILPQKSHCTVGAQLEQASSDKKKRTDLFLATDCHLRNDYLPILLKPATTCGTLLGIFFC